MASSGTLARAVLLAAILASAATAASAKDGGDWFGPAVGLAAVGGPGPGGRVALRPTGTGDYLLRTEFRPGDLTLDEYRARRIAGALVRGTCDRWRAGARTPVPAAEMLTEWKFTFGDVVLPAAWTAEPLAFVLAADDGGGPVRACGDVPLGAVRAYEPVAGAPAATVPLSAPAGAGYGGRVSVWPTPSGYLLVRADLDDRSGNRRALGWSVAEGTCAAWAAERPPPLVTDSQATRLLIDSDGRERRVPHRRQAQVLATGLGPRVEANDRQSLTLVVDEARLRGTAERAVSLAAALPGSGVVCADLPVPSVRGTGVLPRTGTPAVAAPWLLAAVGGALVVGGVAVRGRLGRQR